MSSISDIVAKKKIYKYTVLLNGHVNSIDVPISSRIVHFALDEERYGEGHVWVEFLADDEPYTIPVDYKIVGTGHEFPSHWRHHKTVVTEGAYVWHFYTCGEKHLGASGL